MFDIKIMINLFSIAFFRSRKNSWHIEDLISSNLAYDGAKCSRMCDV